MTHPARHEKFAARAGMFFGARPAWREIADLRRRFCEVQLESFRIADHLDASVRRLDAALLAFEASGQPADRPWSVLVQQMPSSRSDPDWSHKWHSAQFRSTNMRQRGYWGAMLDECGFNILPEQP